MKKCIGYAITGAAIIVLSVLIVIIAAFGATKALEHLNKKYMVMYQADERGVSAPWYRDGFHLVDEYFVKELDNIRADKASIVSLGSSMSIMPQQGDYLIAPSGYAYRNMVCGNGSWKSDRQLYELYKASGVGHNEDVIKLEISFSTFRDIETTIAQSTIDKWGRYSIKDGGVAENTPLGRPLYFVNLCLLKVQNTWELFVNSYEQIRDHIKRKERGYTVIPGNFRNNYFDYAAVANSCNISDNMKNSMRELMEDIDGDHRLIVELSPLPEGLAATDFGQSLNDYIDGELIPYLEERNIPYLDYRRAFTDEEFCDGVHLGYEPACRYSDKLSQDVNELIYRLEN